MFQDLTHFFKFLPRIYVLHSNKTLTFSKICSIGIGPLAQMISKNQFLVPGSLVCALSVG